MITGMHAVIHTRDADADRAFFRDVLGFPSVDAGGGRLIFAVPFSEVACHPAENGGKHELYLMCDNVKTEVALTTMRLPGGGNLALYEPRHPTAHGAAPPRK